MITYLQFGPLGINTVTAMPTLSVATSRRARIASRMSSCRRTAMNNHAIAADPAVVRSHFDYHFCRLLGCIERRVHCQTASEPFERP
jgi:hypothetical protein